MLDKYNRYKLLKIFLDNPTESFRLRELSRLSKISPPSVINYLKEFINQEIVIKITNKKNPIYKSNRDNEDFKHFKKLSILFEIHKSGLIDFIWEKLAPDAIVLYGSSSKGESIENSDIDNYYEVIKEFLVSLNLIKGLKTINENAHKELIELSSKNNIINEQESRLIDDLRIKRNKLLYEGKSIESIYLTNNEDKILSAIKRLKIQAKNNLR
jgi:predicted nucleotidyltransferase